MRRLRYGPGGAFLSLFWDRRGGQYNYETSKHCSLSYTPILWPFCCRRGGQGSENEGREGGWGGQNGAQRAQKTQKGKKSLRSMSGTHISRKKGARRAQDGAQNGAKNLFKNESRTAPNLGNLFKNESRTAPNLGKCMKKGPERKKKEKCYTSLGPMSATHISRKKGARRGPRRPKMEPKMEPKWSKNLWKNKGKET